MATYNWTYQPGKANPYGITVSSSANDVAPPGMAYAALWGNDSTGNGSRMFPYRTITFAATKAGTTIVGNGVYRESSFNAGSTIIGDGDVIIDGYALNTTISFPDAGNYLYNVKFRNLTFKSQAGYSVGPKFWDCDFRNASILSNVGINSASNCTFFNTTINYGIVGNIGNTFYKSYVSYYQGTASLGSPSLNNWKNSVFYQCNIDFPGQSQTNSFGIDFCLFYQCNFRASTSSTLIPTLSVYPNIPSGYTQCLTLAAIQAYLGSVFTSQNSFLPYSQAVDPLFNNLPYYDYSLSFNSPAKNMSYQGGYIGAKTIAYGLNPKTNTATSDFENDTAVNLNIADNSITLTDTSQIGSIITKPIVNVSARELARFAAYGTNADRNGQYVDATADQATVTLNAGNTLTAGTPYSVETGAITYNGTVYQPGARFTTLETNPGTFTTSAGGVVREITEAAARENVQVRFNDGTNPQITAGTALEALGRYYVVSGSITYNGTTYNAGQTFKADNTGTNTFTGSGAIQLIFHDSDPWFYFELGTKPQSNNSGNTRTGAISLGNGDPNFDRTAANVFNINQKFMQLKYTIQVNNLTP